MLWNGTERVWLGHLSAGDAIGGIGRKASCAVGEFVRVTIPSGPAFFKAMMFFLSVSLSEDS